MILPKVDKNKIESFDHKYRIVSVTKGTDMTRHYPQRRILGIFWVRMLITRNEAGWIYWSYSKDYVEQFIKGYIEHYQVGNKKEITYIK